jgi:hypothetical protein
MKLETQAEVWRLIDDYGTAVYWSRDHDVDRIRSDINAILSRHVEQPAETEEQAAIRAALTNIVAACCKIPMARPTDAGLECPHCEARAGESCKPDCWWPAIEAAIDDGREALRLAKET